jgi:hypothetical protein
MQKQKDVPGIQSSQTALLSVKFQFLCGKLALLGIKRKQDLEVEVLSATL